MGVKELGYYYFRYWLGASSVPEQTCSQLDPHEETVNILGRVRKFYFKKMRVKYLQLFCSGPGVCKCT